MKNKFTFTFFIILFIFNIHTASAQLIIKNKYLQITMDEYSGRFTIKTVEGNPFEKNDSNCDILNNTCWPPTTFASIRYNNKIYKFGSSAGDTLFSLITNNKLIYSWEIEDCLISQIISLCMVKSNPSIYIKYNIDNQSDNTNNIDIRLCIDTAVSKEFPVYINSAYSRITTETNCADLREWYSIDSIRRPQLYLKYLLPEDNNNKLQKIIFSSWDKFDKNKWAIKLDKKNPFYNSYFFSKENDDAVGIYWNNLLEPLEIKDNSFILSIGSSKIDENSLKITYHPETNTKTRSISFQLKNHGLRNIENISINFKTDKSNSIAILRPEKKIINLPLFKSKIVQSSYSVNANMMDEDVIFKITAKYPFKTSFEQKINIYSSKP